MARDPFANFTFGIGAGEDDVRRSYAEGRFSGWRRAGETDAEVKARQDFENEMHAYNGTIHFTFEEYVGD
jgi:hypothetical protein